MIEFLTKVGKKINGEKKKNMVLAYVRELRMMRKERTKSDLPAKRNEQRLLDEPSEDLDIRPISLPPPGDHVPSSL